MSEHTQTGVGAGSASYPMAYEDRVAQAYNSTMEVARKAVQLDYQFRNARQAMAKACAGFILTAFSGDSLDVSLRARKTTPTDVADVLKYHGLEPPVPWSYNPFLGAVNHFYFKARVAASETGIGKQYALTDEDAKDEIDAGNELLDRDKAMADPQITKEVALAKGDQTEGARWAMLSRFARWVMIAIDMEDMRMFDVPFEHALKAYNVWLKKEPFADFLDLEVPYGMRKPSVARQPEPGAKRAGRRSTKSVGATPAPTPTPTPPPSPKSTGLLDKIRRITNPDDFLTPDEKLMKAGAEAKRKREAEEAGTPFEELKTSVDGERDGTPAPEQVTEQVTAPDAEQLTEAPEENDFSTDAEGKLHFADETVTQGSVMAPPASQEPEQATAELEQQQEQAAEQAPESEQAKAPEPEQAKAPEQAPGTAEQTAGTEQAPEQAKAPEQAPETAEQADTEQGKVEAVDTSGIAGLSEHHPEQTEQTEPVTIKAELFPPALTARSVIEPKEIARFAAPQEFRPNKEIMALLPDEGLLSYRKLANGKIAILGLFEFEARHTPFSS